MRIISGSAKGRRLKSPSGEGIRPVLDQVKESIFNILFNVAGLSVLDIFAGTGSLGLEALSRGAANAVFIDNGKEAIKLITENIKLCRFEERARLIPQHAMGGIKLLGKEEAKFDIIFIDPPYLKDLVIPTINAAFTAGILKPDGLIITEHHPKEELAGLAKDLNIADQRKYGQTIVTFLVHQISQYGQ